MIGRVGSDCQRIEGFFRPAGLWSHEFVATRSRCGDGLVDAPAGEQCDGGPCAAGVCRSDCTCGFGSSTPTTTTTTTPPPSCGNGVLEAGEVCDGDDLGTGLCPQGGTLACQPDCGGFDTSGCFVCGNGVIEPGETCDGMALGGASCAQGGVLACHADCSSYDDAGCYACANGRREGSEACDGNDIGEATCPTPTYHGGIPGCTGSCTLDYGPDYCWRCGDGVLQGDEECDAGSGNGTPGNNCSTTCERRCGDNVVQQGEQCDDGNRLDGDGCSSLCFWQSTGWTATYAGGTEEDTCSAATPVCVDACYAVWNTAATPPGATVSCADGASCDRDGVRNGQCRIRYFFCLNYAQPVIPGGAPPTCSVRDTKRLELRFPATTLAPADQAGFLDAAQEVLGRFSGSVIRDATSVIRSAGLNRGGVCGGAEVTVPASATSVLTVDTSDSGDPRNSGTNEKTDTDAIIFECTP